ncbi:ATPase domain-containing protein [Halomarina halobia]|uniref:non-specific serine/threonine protein kinase n=1 Tax=Halomarina halobia TaxID=3033386 RepID=A0ABD6AC80_9EURY|nr:ATPase domain-containing protein [Halomarina sp. PSR21]
MTNTTDTSTDVSADELPSRGRVPTGLTGLDEILDGGYLDKRNYLVRGSPGVGKTLIGFHFLAAGVHADDRVLFINLGEAESDIRQNAAQFGFGGEFETVPIVDLSPSAGYFTDAGDIFPPDEVEGRSVTQEIVDEVLAHEPDRVVVDPLSQFRYLSTDEAHFRKQVLSFLKFLKESEATVVLTSESTTATPDDDIQFMSDGVVTLDYSSTARTLEISKFRGSDFQGGTHAVRIDDDGMTVFPRLRPGKHRADFSPDPISSGVPEMDQLLHGGLERGTVTLISGPTGVGKTTTGAQFMKEAAGRGDRSVVYLFEEAKTTFLHRSEAIHMPVRDMIDRGTLAVKEIESLQLSSEELSNDIRHEIEEEDTGIVMIDGIEGYQHTIRGDSDRVVTELHALCSYLQNMGVTTILIGEVGAVTGDFRVTKHEISYLADNVLFLRYLELDGHLRKAIGVLKKRASDFERTLRGFEITEYGIAVGDPLTGLRGVLRGEPRWIEDSNTSAGSNG